jgi:O-antigen ligase
VGVGFGRESTFFVNVKYGDATVPVRQTVIQDPHNDFVYLLAGGGILALGSFALLLAAFARQARRALRLAARPEERVLVLWSCVTLFAFLVNAGSGLTLDAPASLLTIWTLLVLPSAVVAARERAVAAERPRTPGAAPALARGANV